MWILSIRGLLLAGMAAASAAYQPVPGGFPVNLALGTVLGGAIIFLETRIRAMSAKQVAGGFLGALVGVLFALLLSVPLAKIPMASNTQLEQSRASSRCSGAEYQRARQRVEARCAPG